MLISHRLVASVLITLSLAACGGGGGGGGGSTPTAPTPQLHVEMPEMTLPPAADGPLLVLKFDRTAFYEKNDETIQLRYQWYRNGNAIYGANQSIYGLGDDDFGASLTLGVTPYNSQGDRLGPEVIGSTLKIPANAAPTAESLLISGNPESGSSLSASYTFNDQDGDAESGTTLQWFRDGQAIAGETSATYTLSDADIGSAVHFSVRPRASYGVRLGETVVADPARVPLVASEPLQTLQWYIENTGSGQSAAWYEHFRTLKPGADTRVKPVWAKGVTGGGVTVAVFDDGVDFDHPDFAGRLDTGKSHTWYASDAGPAGTMQAIVDSNDWNDHGTAVAGIIGAGVNNFGVVGVAPKAKIVSYRLISEETFDDGKQYPYLQMAFEKSVRVSNHSYGPSDDGKLAPMRLFDYISIRTMVESAGPSSLGHVAVVAAGNGRAFVPSLNDALGRQDDPDTSNFGDYAGLDSATQHPYVLAVGGFNANDQEVSYSEAGPGLLISAPTGDSLPEGDRYYLFHNWALNSDQKPRTAGLVSTGRHDGDYSDYSTLIWDSTIQPQTGFNYGFGGTSGAAPIVSGVAALMISANPALSWRDVRWLLAKTARKIETDGLYINTATLKAETDPNDQIDYWESGGNAEFGRWSHLFGFGAVDANAAVSAALDNYQPLPKMISCEAGVSSGQADFSVVSNCPDTLEFVEISYTIDASVDINALLFTMRRADYGDNKAVALIAPTDCSAPDGCDLASQTATFGGTPAFMGDGFTTPDQKRFSFTSSASGVSATVIKVYGHNQENP